MPTWIELIKKNSIEIISEFILEKLSTCTSLGIFADLLKVSPKFFN
jgi:hypothetical protein